MVKRIKKIFRRKRTTYSVIWKYSFNHEAIIYPTEKGWKKIESMFSEKYIQERKTDNDGYKDLLHVIVTDLGELFLHGSDYIWSNFEIIEKW